MELVHDVLIQFFFCGAEVARVQGPSSVNNDGQTNLSRFSLSVKLLISWVSFM